MGGEWVRAHAGADASRPFVSRDNPLFTAGFRVTTRDKHQ
jgi:hypothetical protein